MAARRDQGSSAVTTRPRPRRPETPPPAAIERGTTPDRVIEHIRSMIANGRLKPGERVNELDIAERLGISRGPVREAVRRLSASGLLIPEPNYGSRVMQLHEESVRHLYDIREALESLAARLAASAMNSAQRSALAEALDRHEAIMDGGASESYPLGDADWDFHLQILRGSGNKLVWRICGEELRDLLLLVRGQHRTRPGRGRRALQEHRWIADALIAGSSDLAATLMAQHIRASRESLLASVRGTHNAARES